MSLEALLGRMMEADLTEAPRKLIEEAIVAWRLARAERLEIERNAKAKQETETALKSWLIEVMRAQGYEGNLIDGRITGLVTTPVATVSNKEELLAHIRATGELELLQFQLLRSAVDERKAAGVKVPGVEYVDVYSLSDKKA